MKHIEKLAILERLITEVRNHGFGEIQIRIKDGQIVHVRSSIDTNWPNDLTVETPLVIIEKIV